MILWGIQKHFKTQYFEGKKVLWEQNRQPFYGG